MAASKKPPTGMKKGYPVMPAYPPKRMIDPIGGMPMRKGEPVPAQDTSPLRETIKQAGRSIDDAILGPFQKGKKKK